MDAAVAMDCDTDDQVLLANHGDGQQQKREQAEETVPDRTALPNSCGERRWRPRLISLRAHFAAGSRGPRRNSLMMAMNRNYLEKVELGKR
jgi:hypothetical protein